jgi:uncharacterized phiE125 gp8 family phage protein
MADPSDLCALGDVKAWLNLSTTSDDTLLASLITNVSGFITSGLNRAVLSASYTETRDGTGGRTLAFGVTPVTAVTSLTINGRTIPPAPDNFNPGYRFGPSRLSLYGFRFTQGYDNVAVSYTAGFASVPDDLAQACIQLVALRYRERDRIGLVSKGLAGEATAFLQKAMTDDVAAVLQRYRRVAPL